ncbi:hypothetical protein [Streptomyces camelliae]|uniref:Uncharacterized protein n=1 Tax=Streptomyces camelliae TaxID=3004093 RepID=A0ABY7NTK7_9ACTN|nr:hypothetical protein [Streptomyces sp. HUAS 2-6]WBO61569.1 hypothetical protein O1G22_01150 [Streptomyces sp. HUAS 2-6]
MGWLITIPLLFMPVGLLFLGAAIALTAPGLTGAAVPVPRRISARPSGRSSKWGTWYSKERLRSALDDVPPTGTNCDW